MKKQILLAFSLVFLVFGLGSAAIIRNLLRSSSSLEYLINLHEIEDIRQNLNLRVQKVQSFVHLSPLDFSYNLDTVIANVDNVDQAIHGCLNCHHAKAVEKEIHYAEQLMNDYQDKLSSMITAGKDDEWRRENQLQGTKIADAITYHVQDMVNRASATMKRRTDDVMHQVRNTYKFLALTLICTLVVMASIARYLTKDIVSQLNILLLATRKLSAGELGYVVDSHGHDEFAQLQQNFNAMSLSLADKERENAGLTRDLQNKIDELRTTQQQLVISEKLASLGLLAGGIAHDFNNIFCGIQGYLRLLMVQIQDDKSSTATLQTIDKAIRHAAQLVNKLRTFAGQRDWQPLPLDMNEIITAVRQDVMAAASGKTVDFDLRLDGALSLVMGDASWLRELIWVISENAVEAVPDPGHIEVVSANLAASEVPGLTVPPATSQPYVRVSVKDNGRGIKGPDLGKVFDPYFSTRELGAQRGIGLGMAIAFSIVKQHGGQIVIDSKEGGGTQVDIYLPAASAA